MRQRPSHLDRLQAAIPLLAVYCGLAALYAWQASQHPVPTIFTDEIELAQLSRSIAETGEPARRGEPYGLATLAAYFLAPVWWLGSTTAAYTAAKLLLVLAMTATIFPAYALARLVVSHWYALAAAAGATAVPALAYSPIFVEEPFAYPLATLALWLIARALVQLTWIRLGVAVLGSATAMLTRTQLSILFAVLALGLLWLAWESGRVRAWRSTWTRWDWLGAMALSIGFAVGFSAAMGRLSESWRETTGFYRDRIVDHATWAAGALAIGIGILPVIAGIAALARPRDEPRDPETRAFVVTSVAAITVFLVYTGIKGAYISTTFSTLIVERNLIYLCPIFFAATALAFERGVGRGWALAGGAALAVYLVSETPLRLDQYPYYEARGLSMATFANRELGWAEGTIENALLVAALIAVAIVVALRLLRRGSVAFAAVASSAAVAVLAWNLTTEVYAAEGERILSERVDDSLTKPYDWVERLTDGGSVVVIGQGITDPTGIWLTEFFNPSIRKVWSIDGSARFVGGPILTPDLAASDGTLTPPPGTEYALALNGVTLQAPVVGTGGTATLYRLDGRALKLGAAVEGLYSDGWMGSSAAYTRYDVGRDGPGFAVVKLSRERWCPQDKPGKATVRIGPVTIGRQHPEIAKVTDTKTGIVHACKTTPLVLAAPRVPWRVEVTIEPTFVPRELDPSRSDARELGAVFDVSFQPLFGTGGG
ncbi:MAG: hypothetical protein M3364_06900 [Actinomycetota bacterium]|nr:hypothetical protein [Actinomycetota bacterium]